jgi:hypothetical protein
MKKFSIAAMNGYTTGESLQFAKHIVRAYNRADIPTQKLEEPLLNFQAAVEALEEVFQERSFEQTGMDITAMDKRRMALISSMRLFLKSRLTLQDAEKVSMVQSVLNILKQNCTEIQYGSLSHRTERIHAFIRDINSKPGLISSIESLQLQDEFKELSEVNQTVFERTDEKALGKKEPAQVPEKQKAIKDAYDILTQKTNAFYLVDENPKVYENILTEIEKHADRFNTSVKIRKSLKKKSNGKDDIMPKTLEL